MNSQEQMEVSDDDVVKQVLDGNVNAFEHLLLKYQQLVFSIVRRHVTRDHVEEVAQEAFIRAYQSLHQTKKVDSFKKWLSTISIRTCYDFWRKRYRSKEVKASELSIEQSNWLERKISDQSHEIWKHHDRNKEAKEVINVLLAKLNAAERMVLELIYLEGYSVKETAGLLGWSPANIKVRAFRARQKLKKMISEGDDK